VAFSGSVRAVVRQVVRGRAGMGSIEFVKIFPAGGNRYGSGRDGGAGLVAVGRLRGAAT
jgi:hypothetical protein